MANILAVGIATIDIINTTDGYPQEDDEVRALSQEIRRGGNATNSLVVLSQLGHQCNWLGCLAEDNNSQLIIKDLDNYNINYSQCCIHENKTTPTSYITLNRNNGSRTIVHYRDIPELSAKNFDQYLKTELDWIHFEARNIAETKKMLTALKKAAPTIPVSIEIEKQRDQLEDIYTGGDIYFFSKSFAKSEAIGNAENLLRHYRALIPNALLVCTWGDVGAYALDGEQLYFSAAAELPNVVDTIGAGDTFNAGFLHASLENKSIQSRLDFANALAGKKCGIHGFNGLG